jgi:hypothetical protein
MHFPPAFCVMVHLGPSLASLSKKGVPFHFDRRSNVTSAQVPNSPDESPSMILIKPFTYIKSGMRPARGSSAGATEVPRIGRVGSSRNERVPPCSSDVGLVELAQMTHFQPLPIFTILYITTISRQIEAPKHHSKWPSQRQTPPQKSFVTGLAYMLFSHQPSV